MAKIRLVNKVALPQYLLSAPQPLFLERCGSECIGASANRGKAELTQITYEYESRLRHTCHIKDALKTTDVSALKNFQSINLTRHSECLFSRCFLDIEKRPTNGLWSCFTGLSRAIALEPWILRTTSLLRSFSSTALFSVFRTLGMQSAQ